MLGRIILGLFIGSIGVAQAAVSPYISASGGVAVVPHLKEQIDGVKTGTYELDTGSCGEVAAGIAITPVRIEAAFMRQSNEAATFKPVGSSRVDASGTVTMKSQMLNGYLDLATDEWFTHGAFIPYFMAGIGNSSVKINNNSESAVAYQFGFGAQYLITENAIVDLGYKFFTTSYKSQASSHTYKIDDIEAHIVQLGLRYQF